MAKVEKLTFDELEMQPSTAPIWVINTSHNVAAVAQHGDSMGEVLIQMTDQHGKPKRLHIEKTWLPKCVSRVFPRSLLLGSIEFRQAVMEGLITLISDKSARLLEASEGADDEREHLQREAAVLRQAGAARGISSEADIRTGDKDLDRQEAEVHSSRSSIDDENTAEIFAQPTEDIAPGITPNFDAWVQRLAQMPEVRARNAIRTREKFTMAELKYLSKHISDKPKVHAIVKAAIERRRAKKRAE